MKSFNLSFDGALFRRGFWIYVWKITDQDRKDYFYIGRTGDSSSPNAAPPFSRISSHLESKANAKGNSLYRAIKNNNIDHLECSFRFSAYGPIFNEPENNNMEIHKPLRDKMAAFEFALYKAFKSAQYSVIGSHASKQRIGESEHEIFHKIIEWANSEFELNLEEMT